MKKAILIALCALAAALIGWGVYARLSEGGGKGGWMRGSLAVAVEVAPVQKRAIREVKLFTGSILPRAYVVVSPKIAGRVEKITVNIGDPVTRGMLIAVLDDAEYEQQVVQAKAELEVARANLQESRSALEISTREFERFKELREQKIASDTELDAAEARFNAREAQLAVAQAIVARREAEVKAAEVRLSYTKIQAHWEEGGGARVLAERFVDEGATLRANEPIVSIVDIETVLAVMHVTELDYYQIRDGQQAEITTDALPGRAFAGTVVRKSPLLKEASRQARVEIEVPNPDGLLKPGMFGRISIRLQEQEEAIIVPASAVVRRGERVGVFVPDLKAMTATFVPVTLGIHEGGRIQILEPELTGQVVTLGHHLLEDGGAIRIPEALPAKGPSKRPPGPPR